MQTLEFSPEGRLNMRGMGGVYSTWYKLQGGKLTTGRLTGHTDDTGSWSIKAGKLTIKHPLAGGVYQRAE
jgi:hypothetical protein